jgi:hypothetical protein
MTELKAAYARGVRASIALLADDRAFGGIVGARAERAFLKTLRVEAADAERPSEGDLDIDGVAEDFLGELAVHARAGGTAGGEDHIDPDRIAALASATLDAPNVGPLARHLFLCSDARCNALLRWEVGGREAARRSLAGPIGEPAAKTGPVPLTRGSPRVIHCRDVLWDAFTRMAQAEGRSVDDLVEEAMARFQAVHETLASPPIPSAMPARVSGRSSIPPPMKGPSVPAIPSLVPPNDDDHEITTDANPPLDDGPPTIAPPPADSANGVVDSEASSKPKAVSTVPAPQEWEPDAPVGKRLGPPDLRAAEDIAELTESLASHEINNDRESTAPKPMTGELKPALFAEYGGRRYSIATPRFVIGRERTTCHLVLPDPNVSRQHAVVEWANGVYFLVDQGSLNGVGCSGHRIHRKQIIDGDSFEICGHSIRFTFRAP